MMRLLCSIWLLCCGVAWGHLPHASHPAYYHADGAGNVTALMDAQEGIAARYLYNPFGKLTGKWGSMAEANRYRFSSKEVHAASGLSYYGFRFYDASLQRWLNPDPLGEAGGINLFGFVSNDPLSFVDPYGEDFHVVGASGMQMPGPLGFLTGDTALETVAAGAYNLLPQTGNMVANVGRGAVEAVAGLLGFADFASEQTGATRVLGRSPSQALEAINPTLLSELQLLKWPKTAKPCAAKTGPTVFRQGTFADEAIGWEGNYVKGRQWATDNPLTTPNYAKKYGLPAENTGKPDWVVGGRTQGPYTTRPAPPSHNNPLNTGGATEVLPQNPNDVRLDWFHMPD